MPIDLATALAAPPAVRTIAWTRRDVLLYHLSLGAGRHADVDPELSYTFERDLQVLPTFAVIPGMFAMGGLISTYLGWQYSGTFHRIGAMSSSFWVCYPIAAPDTKRPIRIYLDSGNKDTASSTLESDTDSLLDTVAERDALLRNDYVFNVDLDHTIGYGHWHNEQWWNVRSPRCFTFLFPTSDEPNTVLPAPRITSFNGQTLAWTSYRLRTYAVEGSTNVTFGSGMTWSNLVTLPAETKRWNYPSVSVTNAFHFFRVREAAVPNWPL